MDMARKKRKQLLRKLLMQIMQGKYNSNKATSNELYPDANSVRQQYLSPLDRDTYNYGYMEIKEMPASDPNNW